jgi:hypothetical protein
MILRDLLREAIERESRRIVMEFSSESRLMRSTFEEWREKAELAEIARAEEDQRLKELRKVAELIEIGEKQYNEVDEIGFEGLSIGRIQVNQRMLSGIEQDQLISQQASIVSQFHSRLRRINKLTLIRRLNQIGKNFGRQDRFSIFYRIISM